MHASKAVREARSVLLERARRNKAALSQSQIGRLQQKEEGHEFQTVKQKKFPKFVEDKNSQKTQSHHSNAVKKLLDKKRLRSNSIVETTTIKVTKKIKTLAKLETKKTKLETKKTKTETQLLKQSSSSSSSSYCSKSDLFLLQVLAKTTSSTQNGAARLLQIAQAKNESEKDIKKEEEKQRIAKDKACIEAYGKHIYQKEVADLDRKKKLKQLEQWESDFTCCVCYNLDTKIYEYVCSHFTCLTCFYKMTAKKLEEIKWNVHVEQTRTRITNIWQLEEKPLCPMCRRQDSQTLGTRFILEYWEPKEKKKSHLHLPQKLLPYIAIAEEYPTSIQSMKLFETLSCCTHCQMEEKNKCSHLQRSGSAPKKLAPNRVSVSFKGKETSPVDPAQIWEEKFKINRQLITEKKGYFKCHHSDCQRNISITFGTPFEELIQRHLRDNCTHLFSCFVENCENHELKQSPRQFLYNEWVFHVRYHIAINSFSKTDLINSFGRFLTENGINANSFMIQFFENLNHL